MTGPREYPHLDGPHLVLGPECFTGDGVEVPEETILWRGAAYVLAPEGSVLLDRDEARIAARALRSVRGDQVRPGPETLLPRRGLYREMGVLARKLEDGHD